MPDPSGPSPFRQSAAPWSGPVAVLRHPSSQRTSAVLASVALGGFTAFVAWLLAVDLLEALVGLLAARAVGGVLAAAVLGLFIYGYARYTAAEVTLYADRAERRSFGCVETFPLEGLLGVRVVELAHGMETVDLAFADGRCLSLRAWPLGALAPLRALVPPLVAEVIERVHQGDEVEFRERPARSVASSARRGCGLLAVALTLPVVLAGHPLGVLVALLALTLGSGALAMLMGAWHDGRAGVAVSRGGVRALRTGGLQVAWSEVESVTRDPAGVRLNVRGGRQIVAATAKSPNRLVLDEVLPALLREHRERTSTG